MSESLTISPGRDGCSVGYVRNLKAAADRSRAMLQSTVLPIRKSHYQKEGVGEESLVKQWPIADGCLLVPAEG